MYSYHQDELDAATIYRMLENEIIPLYYDQDISGVPHRWVQYIKKSLSEIAPDYTTKRMIDDYLERFYSKLLNRSTALAQNNYEKVHNLVTWKRNIQSNWKDIQVTSVDIPDTRNQDLKVGDIYKINVELDLKKLESGDFGIELVYSDGAYFDTNQIHVEEFSVVAKKGTCALYSLEHKLTVSGEFKYLG